jgi:hypothetical protein
MIGQVFFLIYKNWKTQDDDLAYGSIITFFYVCSGAGQEASAPPPEEKVDVRQGAGVELGCRFSPALLRPSGSTLYWIRSNSRNHDNVAIGQTAFHQDYRYSSTYKVVSLKCEFSLVFNKYFPSIGLVLIPLHTWETLHVWSRKKHKSSSYMFPLHSTKFTNYLLI